MNFHKLLQERAESMVNAGRYRDHNLDLLLTKFEVRTVSFGQRLQVINPSQKMRYGPRKRG